MINYIINIIFSLKEENNIKEYIIEGEGYAWIDHVTINQVYKIIISEETVEILNKSNEEICNSILSFVNEIGYVEYNNNKIKIIYTYE